MPQSASGSTTHVCQVQCTLEAGEILVWAGPGCSMSNGVLQAKLPEDKECLRFSITDFQTNQGHYEVKARSAFGGGSLTLWDTPTTGEHWSPPLMREPKTPPVEEYTVEVALVIEVYGPILANSPAGQKAGEVKPPTTVVIRSRLGDP